MSGDEEGDERNRGRRTVLVRKECGQQTSRTYHPRTKVATG
jgi:hypothetical protein